MQTNHPTVEVVIRARRLWTPWSAVGALCAGIGSTVLAAVACSGASTTVSCQGQDCSGDGASTEATVESGGGADGLGANDGGSENASNGCPSNAGPTMARVTPAAGRDFCI